jgi:hypothetical protein
MDDEGAPSAALAASPLTLAPRIQKPRSGRPELQAARLPVGSVQACLTCRTLWTGRDGGIEHGQNREPHSTVRAERRAVRAAKDGGTISKIHIEIQWDVTQWWDTPSY